MKRLQKRREKGNECMIKVDIIGIKAVGEQLQDCYGRLKQFTNDTKDIESQMSKVSNVFQSSKELAMIIEEEEMNAHILNRFARCLENITDIYTVREEACMDYMEESQLIKEKSKLSEMTIPDWITRLLG